MPLSFYDLPSKNPPANPEPEKVKRLQEKSQNRLLFLTAFIGVANILHFYFSSSQINPIPVSITVLTFAHFKLKNSILYKPLQYFFLIVGPLASLINPAYLLPPAVTIYSSYHFMIYTNSHWLTFLHLLINASFTEFYAIKRIGTKFSDMDPQTAAQQWQFYMKQALWFSYSIFLILQLQKHEQDRLMKKIERLSQALADKSMIVSSQNDHLKIALERKEAFIFTFSHEVKNALNGLFGNLNLAYEYEIEKTQHHKLRSDGNKRLIQYLSSAKVCGELLKNFVHNVLDTGKIENSSLEVAKERRDVGVFLQDVWTICSQLIRNKRLKGFLRMARNVPKFLELDSQRMLQIMLNLTSNAVKFTDKGHIFIQVSWIERSLKSETETSLRENDDPETVSEFPHANGSSCIESRRGGRLKKFMDNKDFELNFDKQVWDCEDTLEEQAAGGTHGVLRIQVVDSGCGMTSDQQKYLFQKFSQVSMAAESRKIGTGLGLWICKEIAKLLNGDITVKSTPEVGSVFEFSIETQVPSPAYISKPIPRYDSFGAITTSDKHGSMIFERRGKPRSGLKVLIADDDGFNIELMKNYLQKLDLEYICAYDGQEEVNLFEMNYRDIVAVITDNYMPQKTGIQAAKEITAFLHQRGRPAIPILCISGDAKVDLEGTSNVTLLSKPVNFSQIKEKLSGVFDHF